MQRFVLISTDPDQEQCFIDTVIARTETHALSWLKAVRDYVSYTEVFTVEDFLRAADYVRDMSNAECLVNMKDLIRYHR
jgi:hypothetical protein